MGARRVQTQLSVEILDRIVPPVAAADANSESIASPAVLLQHRLDAAVAAAPWEGRPEPAVRRWPGALRLAVLALGAGGSWAGILLATRALI